LNLVEDQHIEYNKKLIKKLGNIPLSDSEIRKEAKILNLPNFKGVIMQNGIIPKGNCTYIMNVDYVGGPGIHWIGVVQHGRTIYVYDSYGRKTTNLVSHFAHTMISRGFKIKDTDRTDQEQYGSKTVNCGHLTLAALMIHKKYGLEGYMKL
jgi:hypothetical protein